MNAMQMNASRIQRSVVASRPSRSLGTVSVRRVGRLPGYKASGVVPRRRDSFAVKTKEGAVEGVGAGVVGEVNDGNFDEIVLKSSIPVIVDFWAPWCGPCRMIAPMIEELADEYGDKLLCVKLNTDTSPGVANKYGIRSIPTVMLFKDGDRKDAIIGAVPKTTFNRTIDRFMD